MQRIQANRPIERHSAEPKFSLADSPTETKSKDKTASVLKDYVDITRRRTL